MSHPPLKTLLVICWAILFFQQPGYSATLIYPAVSTAKPVAATETDFLKASVFVKLSAKEFSALTGTKLNFLQKLYFKSVKRKLSRELKKDPNLLITQYYDQHKAKFKIDPVWFAVGVILGPLGILFSFTSKQPKAKRKSTALGCIVFVIWFGFLFIF